MEPFGLFHLLKALLPNPQSSDAPTGESSPPQSTNSAPEKTPPISAAPPATPLQGNACLDFISRHDERAKHLRK